MMLKTIIGHIWKEQRKKVLTAFGKPILRPWMKEREIDLLAEILERNRPRKCLEWGAGCSTLFFSGMLTKHAKWTSIEHRREWAETTSARNRNPNARIYHIPARHEPFSDPNHDGRFADMPEYVEFPALFAPYDFILVDGRARVDCLDAAIPMLSPCGLLVLHDANRAYYRMALPEIAHHFTLLDYRRTAGGFWFGSKEKPIGSFFDIEKHTAVWAIHNRIGRVTRS